MLTTLGNRAVSAEIPKVYVGRDHPEEFSRFSPSRPSVAKMVVSPLNAVALSYGTTSVAKLQLYNAVFPRNYL
jgi:hypothetical protein